MSKKRAKETKSSAGRRRRSNAARYFTPRTGGRMTPGIYERKGRKAPKKIFAFTDKAPSYQKAFKFYPKMNAAAGRRFPRNFYRALTPATGVTMEVWDRGAEEWQAAAQVPKAPVGYLLARNCTYRVTATVGSTDTPPAAVLEAYRRLAEYMASELSAPVGAKSYSVRIGQISERISLDRDHAAATIHKSGAADLLRPYRRLGVNDEAA